jgi:rSAM/selenodomain-associated transferase 1
VPVWISEMDDRGSHNARSQRCAIAIMAKAPGAGRIKTRLASVLNPQEANGLGCCFLRDMTANLALAAQSAPIDAYVAFAPAGTEAAFEGLIEPGTGFVLADGSMRAPAGVAGLGTCLLQAMSLLFDRGYGAAGLLNSDSPNLPTGRLIEAAGLLASPGERVVLGPASDGGYYFIGAKALHVDVFRDIDWSTQRVAEQTRARAVDLGLAVVELAPWYDVDDVASLGALVRDLQPGSRTGAACYAAPATGRFLESNRIADRLAAKLAAAGR